MRCLPRAQFPENIRTDQHTTNGNGQCINQSVPDLSRADRDHVLR